ncbi:MULTISPECIES: pyridoxal phosphate-dependent aminotransferase [unclassified Sedimentibacter]|uniref:pyridoxal phosphate-dependent aminotransferase n=1 Tax=unclassified Sedimentibacter TaxID=2649220 RepID=UPI0027E00191|nr:pyridoxal phosphate-dependent aminotransferase [Sedimentibacter sp. MB35-C1]WMJ77192.1 pyridoxal phosphate-dependent aminotransferase [Sedimentibacter sp. MB35-C1]
MIACNDRLEAMPFGGLYEIFAKANRLEEQGKRIIHMEIGRPDFDSPDFAKEAVKLALDKGQVHYTDINGIEPLRKAIIEKEERRFGLKYDYETEISVTSGAAEAIGVIMLTMMNPGDEIICPSPYFSAYKEQAIIAGVKLVEVPVLMSENWELNVDRIKDRITPKTKMLLINSPNNPAGYVLNKENLEKIADLAKANDLIVISDECYDEFIYGEKHVSISTLEDMRDRTLVVKSTSKSFSMTGWRIGYVLGSANAIKYINKVHQNFSTCATAFAQWGAVEAFKNGDEFIDSMVKEFKRRGDYLYEAFTKIDGLKMIKPKGAFYAFPDITSFGMSEKDFCNYLMEEAGVVGVPGTSFGDYGKGHVRLAYCRSYEDIIEACDKIKTALGKL